MKTVTNLLIALLLILSIGAIVVLIHGILVNNVLLVICGYIIFFICSLSARSLL